MRKKINCLALVTSLLCFHVPVGAQDTDHEYVDNEGNKDASKEGTKTNIKTSSGISLNELVLPSELTRLNKTPGSIYFSPSVKGKVLIPVHIWGEVSKSGLHFFPIDTTLVNGLSFAGGASANGELDNVKVTRVENGEVKSQKFNLEQGGSNEAYEYKLRPGDTVFVPKTRFYENRTYYTSLFGVIATVLSSILLYRQVDKNNN